MPRHFTENVQKSNTAETRCFMLGVSWLCVTIWIQHSWVLRWFEDEQFYLGSIMVHSTTGSLFIARWLRAWELSVNYFVNKSTRDGWLWVCFLLIFDPQLWDVNTRKALFNKKKNVCRHLFHSWLRFYWHSLELKQEGTNELVELGLGLWGEGSGVAVSWVVLSGGTEDHSLACHHIVLLPELCDRECG